MRTFKIYSPLMIAKYVSSFFKGQFEVAEQGIFVFDGGKVLIDENSSEIQRKVIIAGFLAHSRPSNLQYQ